MSREKNLKEATRWLNTAKEDIEAANILKEAGKYAHACFLYQQAVEKAIKSIYYYNEENPWGHSIIKLIEDLRFIDLEIYKNLKKFKEKGMILDRFYIPTRYPNGLPDITPKEAFGKSDAILAKEIAEEILSFVSSILQ